MQVSSSGPLGPPGPGVFEPSAPHIAHSVDRIPDHPGQGHTVPTLYNEHAAFVWRNLRRLGIPEAALDDATQDVFLVVHRRLSEFAGDSQIRTWLFGITLRVASSYRRSWRRRRERIADVSAEEVTVAPTAPGDSPFEAAARREALAFVHRILDDMNERQRAMFVSVDMEQLTVPEAARALGINLNTAYARLRAARILFNKSVAVHRRTQLEGERP